MVGAGAVGTELAGELRDYVPGVQVSLVQRDKLVLNATYPNSFRQRVTKSLDERGVTIITDDTIVNLEEQVLDGTQGIVPGRTVTTSKGVTLPAELIVRTRLLA